MERKWIAVAFMDILGFGIWRKRAFNTPEIADPFVQKFYDEIRIFVLREKCLNIKYLGDGIMVIKDFSEKVAKRKGIVCFLKKMLLLTKRLQRVVQACEWPAPDGFRTRVVCGHVSKLKVVDPNDRSKEIDDYIGYPLNLAQRLLEISPNTPFLCHESVIKVLGPQKRSFKVKRLGIPPERPRGTDIEDISGLWMFEL